jgi:hypothetical protein
LCFGLGGIWSKPLLTAFLTIFGAYFLTLAAVSVKKAAADRDWSACFLLPFVTLSMHLARGFGSLWGVLRLIVEGRLPHAISLLWKERSLRRPVAPLLSDRFEGG